LFSFSFVQGQKISAKKEKFMKRFNEIYSKTAEFSVVIEKEEQEDWLNRKVAMMEISKLVEEVDVAFGLQLGNHSLDMRAENGTLVIRYGGSYPGSNTPDREEYTAVITISTVSAVQVIKDKETGKETTKNFSLK
jgi:hypothetical protein